jgi:hypothetical protein
MSENQVNVVQSQVEGNKTPQSQVNTTQSQVEERERVDFERFIEWLLSPKFNLGSGSKEK